MQLKPPTCRQQREDSIKFPATCPNDNGKDELIRACDKALNDCAQANNDKQAVINQQERIMVDQQNQLDECRKDQDSLWSKPWFTITLGVVGALLLILVTGHAK